MANHGERRGFRSFPEFEKAFDPPCGTFELNALDFGHDFLPAIETMDDQYPSTAVCHNVGIGSFSSLAQNQHPAGYCRNEELQDPQRKPSQFLRLGQQSRIVREKQLWIFQQCRSQVFERKPAA